MIELFIGAMLGWAASRTKVAFSEWYTYPKCGRAATDTFFEHDCRVSAVVARGSRQ